MVAVVSTQKRAQKATDSKGGLRSEAPPQTGEVYEPITHNGITDLSAP